MQHVKFGLLVASLILTRLPFFFHLPQLSDDFYRFLWDGLLLTEGINPFGAVPTDMDLTLFGKKEFAERLLAGMNSAGYGSVYPPLHQAVFWIGAKLSGGSLLGGVNAMRAVIVLAEAGMAAYFLRFSGLKNAGFIMAAYLLNPLVVVEGVGNAHMEALMVPLLAVGLHMLISQKTLKGSLLFAGSVLVKLTPLLLAPMLFFRKEGSNRWLMAATVVVAVAIAFLPFAPWYLFSGVDGSFGLYFQSFEFNASVYYLLREAFTPIVGYNPIAVLGPVLAGITVLVLLWIALRAGQLDFYTAALYSYVAYYLLATTVHPWYLIPVVYLSLAAKRPVWLVWSFTVWFSYSHYLEQVGPKWGWLVLEYGILAMAILVDSRRWFGRRRLQG
ncbi:MAG: hypothetical protein LC670_14830 [Flavobacteriales bacterium]|nr:hypothetical protein [Flavobacteriales bacterium]